VLTLLEWRWSPQQISGTLKRIWPRDLSMHVSHEPIYNAIYARPRGELRRQLIACLRQAHSTRKPRTRGQDRRGQLADMLSIHVRPPEVEDRVMPGHWEGDFIKGAANRSAVGVLVERTKDTPSGMCVWIAPIRNNAEGSVPKSYSSFSDSRYAITATVICGGSNLRVASGRAYR
jgi:IS30 family transposase